jgi:hypothetical protein
MVLGVKPPCVKWKETLQEAKKAAAKFSGQVEMDYKVSKTVKMAAYGRPIS